MNTTQTRFPACNALDMAFPCLRHDEMKQWIAEANEAKYDSKFERMASSLFFSGGKVPKKQGVSDEEYSIGRAYLQKWLGSFDPKHEDKELVAGYILSRISV